MTRKSQSMILLMAAATAVMAVACTRHVSRGISPQGTADEVIFPPVERMTQKDGTFPGIDNLRQIGPGIGKDPLYDLIGKPHFREGAFGVREWDYLFHFRRGDEVTTCRYKVIFDREYRGQSFHWEPSTCADLLDDAGEGATLVQRVGVRETVLFEFARHDLDAVLPGDRDTLASIAHRLQPTDAGEVRVIGHADRIGTREDGLRLSQRRADTVRHFLVEQGVASDRVYSQARGASEPVEQCDDRLERSALVACLQPNRRVEIVADGAASGACRRSPCR